MGRRHELTMNESARGPFQSAANVLSMHWQERLRRALDIFASLIALSALTPLGLLVAALIKLDSPGPILFRQTRIGRNRRRSLLGQPAPDGMRERRELDLHGRPFTLYKFRTMFSDARERFPDLYRYEYSEQELRSLPIKVLVAQKLAPGGVSDSPGAISGLGKDPRITRLGHWLRRTSLDEIPNLLNVLKGDMHLVGPRPDIAANIRYYDPRELRILDVKPGITGLAQIMGRGFLTFEETNAYDLDYLEHRSLALDLKILFRTLPALIRRHGAF